MSVSKDGVSEKRSAGWPAQVSGLVPITSLRRGTEQLLSNLLMLRRAPAAPLPHFLCRVRHTWVSPLRAWKGENGGLFSLAVLSSVGLSAGIPVRRAARSNREDGSRARPGTSQESNPVGPGNGTQGSHQGPTPGSKGDASPRAEPRSPEAPSAILLAANAEAKGTSHTGRRLQKETRGGSRARLNSWD